MFYDLSINNFIFYDFYNVLGYNLIMKNLRDLRKSRGMLQKDVADAIGVANSTYCSYEIDINEPSISILKKLAALFEVSIDVLLDYNCDELFSDARVSISEAQRLFNSLTPQQQELILERMRAYDDFNRNS